MEKPSLKWNKHRPSIKLKFPAGLRWQIRQGSQFNIFCQYSIKCWHPKQSTAPTIAQGHSILLTLWRGLQVYYIAFRRWNKKTSLTRFRLQRRSTCTGPCWRGWCRHTGELPTQTHPLVRPSTSRAARLSQNDPFNWWETQQKDHLETLPTHRRLWPFWCSCRNCCRRARWHRLTRRSSISVSRQVFFTEHCLPGVELSSGSSYGISPPCPVSLRGGRCRS